jgi:uncharacterized lipoprotein YmbA
MTRFVILTALAVTLAGCMPDLRSEHPPQRTYWLEPATVADAPSVSVRVSLVPGLDTDRIQVLEPDMRLNHYAGAFWADNLEPLLSSLLDRSLDREGGQPVEVVVERFFAVAGAAGAPPTVEVRALIDTDSRQCTFEWRTTAASDRLRDIVAAHQEGVDRLTAAVADAVGAGPCP